ncbi:trigger factor [Pacificimonas flava]|uniref:Trigger factor n=2 Tax=Pacificimonas TaxID=1960290 RepID=A0A219B6Q7_9SPHN|nr:MULTISPECIES: trigger factor [Pacificimonas]MBZ6378657.1 trigger factor [Pacificimonas aurantium]OWV34072.1 trigger factor [Pacificimonas flava]
MRIDETKNEGLARAYTVTIPADAIEAKVDAQLTNVSKNIRMPGFRPGKVPKNLVRKMHGEALYGEALQTYVQEGVQQVLSEKQLRPAGQPSVDLKESGEGKDVVFAMELEVLPQVEVGEMEPIKLEKLTVEAGDEELNEALEKFAEQQKSTEAAAKTYKAKEGDTVVMDFVGKVDGEEFEGGTGEGLPVELGSGRLIPGFEDQLEGAKANDQKTVKVTFPEDYPTAYLRGREAEFDVTVTEIRKPVTPKVDDDLAKNLGLEGLDQLKDILGQNLNQELENLSRTYMKRKLLDTLSARYDFDVPPSMVDQEFDTIWQQLEHEAGHAEDPEAAKEEIEADRDDYRRIAERRVRLGLLLSEIGREKGVEVTQQEMQQLVLQEAQKYPGQQQQVMEYFQKNPMAAAQLRAPLFEDKVVDALLADAETTERKVTRADLEAAIEDEDESPEAKPAPAKKPAAKKAPAKKTTAKKPAAKKPAAKTGDEDTAAAKKAPAKKAAAKKPAAKTGDEDTAAAKKSTAKKPAAKKAAAKKPAAKKALAKKSAAKSED